MLRQCAAPPSYGGCALRRAGRPECSGYPQGGFNVSLGVRLPAGYQMGWPRGGPNLLLRLCLLGLWSRTASPAGCCSAAGPPRTSVTIDTTATPPELGAAFRGARSAGWKHRSKCPSTAAGQSNSISYILALVPSAHDMIHGPGILNAQLARHGQPLPAHAKSLNSQDLHDAHAVEERPSAVGIGAG